MRFAFPDDKDPPTYCKKYIYVAGISRDIAPKLVDPELKSSLQYMGGLGSAVPMSETVVHKNHGLIPWTNKIRPTGETYLMETVMKSHAICKPTHGDFGDRVATLDRSYPSTPLLAADDVYHASYLKDNHTPLHT